MRDRSRDLREALRSVQDHRLGELIEDEFDDFEREGLEELRRDEIRSLRPMTQAFLEVMKVRGNPGLQRFHRAEQVSAGGIFSPPKWRTAKSKVRGWPLVQEIPNPHSLGQASGMFALTTQGEWWSGSLPPETDSGESRRSEGPFFVIERVDPMTLSDRSDFCSIGGNPRMATGRTFDSAAIYGIAVYLNKYDLEDEFNFT